jgi:hypothetical protein
MKKRLTYSPEAFIKRMQMSSRLLFAFVEGKTDRYFYGRICERVATIRAVSYEITSSEELPVAAPGKGGLVEWFTFLSNNHALCSLFKGKKTVAVFFADKDIDDLLGTMLESPHFMYTQFYCLENQLVAQGNLIDSMAAAASLDAARVQDGIGVDSTEWRRRAAESWREWTTLCVFTRLHGLNCPTNYSRGSQIHPEPFAAADHAALATHIDQIRVASGAEQEPFQQNLQGVTEQVHDIYAAGNFDLVFKGSWYVDFAAAEIRRIAVALPYDPGGVHARFIQTLAMSAPLDGGWPGQVVNEVTTLLGCAAAA